VFTRFPILAVCLWPAGEFTRFRGALVALFVALRRHRSESSRRFHICRLYSGHRASISNLYAAAINSPRVGISVQENSIMLDTILLAAGVVGLLLTVAYAYACARL
jgi:hypothetical protein